jgi:hypothetical protein
MVRAKHFLACALLVGVLGWSAARAESSEVVEVRVYGDSVNFRKEIPRTFPQQELVQRHLERIETLSAHFQRLGPSPDGGVAPWFYVTNRASGESGWVISTYLQTIDPGDVQNLRSLPFESVEPQDTTYAIEDVERVYHLSFVGFVLTLGGFLIAIYAVGHGRGSNIRKVQSQTPTNVVSFPAPAEPDTLFGMAGDHVWVHRSRRKS